MSRPYIALTGVAAVTLAVVVLLKLAPMVVGGQAPTAAVPLHLFRTDAGSLVQAGTHRPHLFEPR
jgi:hypothetical protein